MGLRATRSVCIKVATAVAVALENGAADGGGNVATAPARLRRVGILFERVGPLGILLERSFPSERVVAAALRGAFSKRPAAEHHRRPLRRGLLRASRRASRILLLELRDESAHGAHLKLLQRHVRNGV